MTAQVTTSNIGQARACLTAHDCMSLYETWAATYNDDVRGDAQNYVAPILAAQAALKSTTNPAQSTMLDAGCGTGLVAQALAMSGVKTIDGLDLSPAMLKVAAGTGVYRNLSQADLTKPIGNKNDTYDVVTCVGTFTLGHVGPDPALRELVRVTKRQGVVVATVLEEIWLSGGFQNEVEKLTAEKLVTVVTAELIDYVKGHGDKAMLVILRKQ